MVGSKLGSTWLGAEDVVQVPSLRQMWIASVLLFQYALTFLFTLAPSQLMACWDWWA